MGSTQAKSIALSQLGKEHVEASQFEKPISHRSCYEGACYWLVEFHDRNKDILPGVLIVRVNDQTCAAELLPSL